MLEESEEEEVEYPEKNLVKCAQDIISIISSNQSNYLVETECFYDFEK